MLRDGGPRPPPVRCWPVVGIAVNIIIVVIVVILGVVVRVAALFSRCTAAAGLRVVERQRAYVR